jgi:hypothetical protein
VSSQIAASFDNREEAFQVPGPHTHAAEEQGLHVGGPGTADKAECAELVGVAVELVDDQELDFQGNAGGEGASLSRTCRDPEEMKRSIRAMTLILDLTGTREESEGKWASRW